MKGFVYTALLPNLEKNRNLLFIGNCYKDNNSDVPWPPHFGFKLICCSTVKYPQKTQIMSIH